MKNIKLIIFDVDGVLIDSKQNMKMSWEKLCKENELNIKFQEYFKYIGTSFKKILNKLNVYKNQKNLEKNYFINSKKFIYKIKPYKGVNNELKFLQKKYILSIITSKNKNNTQTFLKKFFPKIKFSLICTPNKNLRPKPYPDLFNYTFKKLNISPINSLFIGDTIYDFQASKKVKTNFVFAEYGYSKKKINSKYIIKNISELKKYLKK
tara:strand:+ start:245 stop:868 length:624 start_codon:yes stop_codon:yes gene_type:complete